MTTAITPLHVEDLASATLDRLPGWVLDAIADVPIVVMNAQDDLDPGGPPRIVLVRDELQATAAGDDATLAALVEDAMLRQIAQHLTA